MPAVVELWRYPVKSMAGEQLDRTPVAPRITGDREWGVFDAATGKLLSAKSVAALITARARFRDGVTTITLPDGRELTAGTAATNDALSTWLARPVVLRGAAAAEVSTIDMDLLDGGTSSFTTEPGMLFDSRSLLHLISTTTFAAIEHMHAPGAGDHRRYRPNIVVTEADEDSWVGRDLALGTGIVAHVRKRTERCVMVTRAQAGGIAADRELLRTLVTRRDTRVGVYLDPRTHGELAVGDAIELAAL